MLDLDSIADVVAGAVCEATAPLIAENKAMAERIASLETRQLPAAIKGDPGEVDMEAVKAILSDLVSAAFATMPVPKDGESVDPTVIKQMVDDAIAALPAPVPAEPDAAAIENAVAASVARAVSALPVPKDGNNGIGLAGALIDRDGNLVLTLTDGCTKELGRVIGKDGTNAPPAVPFTLNDFDIVQSDDDRTFKFCFTHGDVMHSFEFEFPVIIYRDVWKPGPYARGDAVTWAGSLWIAQRATDGKPDTPDSGWRLAVKKGRDGKDK